MQKHIIFNCQFTIITLEEYFVARFNDVHAFGYNSAGSERIWMKFGELRVYCLELALLDFGRDPPEARAGDLAEVLFFFVR